MTDKEKILKYLEYKKISKNKFYSQTGFSVGFLDSGKSLGVDKLRIIIDNYHDLNPMWIISDIGEMIKTTQKERINPIVNEPQSEYRIKPFNLKTDRSTKNQLIPLYNLEASAGLVELFRHHNDLEPIDTLSIPNLPKCDGAVFVVGDSMYPLLKSGDIVVYKQIQDIANGIFWGEMYLVSVQVDDEEFISVKYIQKSDNGPEWIKLVSQNSHHSPKDVHLSTVRALAIIKASVRINTM